MPPSPPPEKINTKYIRDCINYFNRAMRRVKHKRDAHVLKEALADTIGAHMRNEILPNARFAYYAGYVKFDSVNELHEIYQRIKKSLNTQGLGWKKPDKIPLTPNFTVAKILIDLDKSSEPCSDLIIKRYDNQCIHIPLPKVDDDRQPAALALPYKSGGFYSMSSPNSQNVLLKYYKKAARCILQSSPARCRREDFVTFNNDLWHWLKQYVAPHLMDEELYSVYGGVLRVAAAVQNHGKGLSRRHLFTHWTGAAEKKPARIREAYDTKLFSDQVYTPPLFVLVILGAALAVCCLHILYAYVFGPTGACNCPSKGNRGSESKKDVAYTTVDSNFPAMLPPPKISKYTDEKVPQHAFSFHESKSTCAGTDKKDVKDNVVSAMSVLVTDKELSETESSSDEKITALNRTVVGSIHTLTTNDRRPRNSEVAPSPIKIERTTAKSQKTSKNIPKYSTTNVSKSDVTYTGQMSESCCSECSSTERSGSSFDSSSRERPSSRSRDLAWAKKVVRRQKLRSISRTSYDHNSNTTPTSYRQK
ncbi:hypothetical protein NE865_05444 [Phthorimaea operculella]|nr:hypothetical protein NE865_05444 [Phthorimaea operculella]